MTAAEFLRNVGLDPYIVTAGGLGGLFRSLSGRNLKLRERIVSPICGAICAGYTTYPVAHYMRATALPLPPDDLAVLGASAFVVGTCGMWVSDALLDRLVRWIKAQGAKP